MLGPKPRTVVPRTQNRYKMKLEEKTNKNIRAEVIHIYIYKNLYSITEMEKDLKFTPDVNQLFLRFPLTV